MKYSEFKSLTENESVVLKVKENDHGFFVINNDTGNIVLTIDKKSMYSFSTIFGGFKKLPRSYKEELVDRAIELASTPLKDREDEKRYRLRLPFAMESGGYLNTYGDKLFVSSKANVVDYKNIFTESKIAELKAKHNLDSFVLEKVKEDE